MDKIKCVVLQEPYKIDIEERPFPELAEGEVLLESLYTGICGSDITQYHGNFFLKVYPLIQGHEFSARIVKVDPNNKYGLKEGMLVTGLPYYGCGECPSCKKGFPNVCAENKTFGGLRDGANRQYFAYPDWRIYNCDGLDPKVVALIEPLCIGRHCTKRADIKPGEKILVIGAGTIGLVAALNAMNQGGEVTISDVQADKLDMVVREFGIPNKILNDDPATFVDKCKAATGGHGYDVVIDCVGATSTFQASLEAAMIGGKVISVGAGHASYDFDFKIIMQKHLDVLGSRNAVDDDFRSVIELLRTGGLGPVEKMITKVFPYEDAAAAFDYVDKNNSEVLKGLLQFAE